MLDDDANVFCKKTTAEMDGKDSSVIFKSKEEELAPQRRLPFTQEERRKIFLKQGFRNVFEPASMKTHSGRGKDGSDVSLVEETDAGWLKLLASPFANYCKVYDVSF